MTCCLKIGVSPDGYDLSNCLKLIYLWIVVIQISRTLGSINTGGFKDDLAVIN
jgi:hypothetical protein